MVSKTSKSKPEHSDKSVIIIGKIYAEWCGHCQNLKPIWENIKMELKPNQYIVFEEIEDVDIPKKLDILNDKYLPHSADKITADGYPTIFKIQNGGISYYTGNREQSLIHNWIISKGGSSKHDSFLSPVDKKRKTPSLLDRTFFSFFGGRSKSKNKKTFQTNKNKKQNKTKKRK
jgi:thiol-disulfide isomerase/thioredoxin